MLGRPCDEVGGAVDGVDHPHAGRRAEQVEDPGIGRDGLLADDDPLLDEWAIVVPSAEPVVMAAIDLRSDSEDLERRFLYAVSRDPEVVAECARLLGATSREGASVD